MAAGALDLGGDVQVTEIRVYIHYYMLSFCIEILYLYVKCLHIDNMMPEYCPNIFIFIFVLSMFTKHEKYLLADVLYE